MQVESRKNVRKKKRKKKLEIKSKKRKNAEKSRQKMQKKKMQDRGNQTEDLSFFKLLFYPLNPSDFMLLFVSCLLLLQLHRFFSLCTS
jgi:hypothetical protein